MGEGSEEVFRAITSILVFAGVPPSGGASAASRLKAELQRRLGVRAYVHSPRSPIGGGILLCLARSTSTSRTAGGRNLDTSPPRVAICRKKELLTCENSSLAIRNTV